MYCCEQQKRVAVDSLSILKRQIQLRMTVGPLVPCLKERAVRQHREANKNWNPADVWIWIRLVFVGYLYLHLYLDSNDETTTWIYSNTTGYL